MRNTDSAGNTAFRMSFSSRALFRSWPNGFSITTRRHGRRSDQASWPGGGV
jgi:hypothetical protein